MSVRVRQHLRFASVAVLAAWLVAVASWLRGPEPTAPLAMPAAAAVAAPRPSSAEIANVLPSAASDRDEAERHAAGARIRGRTLDGEGAALPGIAVVCTNGTATRSDNDGRFEIAGIAPGSCSMLAEGDGCVAVPSGPIQLRGQEVVDGIELVLERACFVAGRVATPDGMPLAGARVVGSLHLVQTRPGVPAIAFAASTRTVVTDAAGRFRIGPFVPGEIALAVEHEGHAPFTRRYHSDATDLAIVLEPVGCVHGIVLGTEGERPACIERVLLLVTSGVRDGWNVAAEITPDAAAAATGRFRVPVVTPREVRVVVVTRDCGLATSSPLRVPRGSVHGPLALRAAGGERVTGTIHDATGQSVAAAEIRIRSDHARFEPVRATSGPDGGFAFVLAPGSYTVQLQKPGHEALRLPLEVVEGEPVRTLDWVLVRGVTLSGRIVSEGGAVLPSLEVLALRIGVSTASPAVAGVADGSYRFDGLPPGDYRLAVRERGDRSAPNLGEPVHLAVGESRQFDLHPRSLGLGGLRGVLACGDRPAAFATVRLLRGRDREFVSATADRLGHFAFDGLLPGEITVVVSELPTGPRLCRHRVTVRSGEVTELPLEFACGSASGRVLSAATQLPFADVKVELFTADGFLLAATRTDAAGEFHLPRVAEGEGMIGYSRPGQTTCRQVSVAVSSQRPVRLAEQQL